MILYRRGVSSVRFLQQIWKESIMGKTFRFSGERMDYRSLKEQRDQSKKQRQDRKIRTTREERKAA